MQNVILLYTALLVATTTLTAPLMMLFLSVHGSAGTDHKPQLLRIFGPLLAAIVLLVLEFLIRNDWLNLYSAWLTAGLGFASALCFAFAVWRIKVVLGQLMDARKD